MPTLKKYHHSHHEEMTTPTFEDWEGPLSGMPETDLGDSREGIDRQIEKDNIKKSKIRPRGV